MVKDLRKIAFHYLSSWFLVDAVACIPFVAIFGQGEFILFRMLRVLKASYHSKSYVCMCVTCVHRCISSTVVPASAFHSDQLLHHESLVMNKNALIASEVTLLRLGLYLVVIMHNAACIWYFIAVLDNQRSVQIGEGGAEGGRGGGL